jgi:tRNA threonylcarbamoyladenosine biosynthesis protein TsaB
MKILAFEFSSAQRSVAVLHRSPGAAVPAVSEVVESGTRDCRPLAMTEQALRLAGLEREQLDRVAVGLGPGSYGGIRSALALAQGWQLGRGPGGLKLLGISSVECLVAQLAAEGLTGRVQTVIDAQRQEFYLAAYELGAGVGRELAPLRLAPLAEVEALERAGELLVGPEVARWFPRARVVFPQAATLARLALARTDFQPGEQLEPIYLRETRFVKAPPPRPWPDRAPEPTA